MNEILIPISPGELLDKITILQIKSERIDDATKVANVRTELDMLQKVWTDCVDEDDEIPRSRGALIIEPDPVARQHDRRTLAVHASLDVKVRTLLTIARIRRVARVHLPRRPRQRRPCCSPEPTPKPGRTPDDCNLHLQR